MQYLPDECPVCYFRVYSLCRLSEVSIINILISSWNMKSVFEVFDLKAAWKDAACFQSLTRGILIAVWKDGILIFRAEENKRQEMCSSIQQNILQFTVTYSHKHM